MHPWKRIVLNALRPIDQMLDSSKFYLKKQLGIGKKSPISIVNYRGYCSRGRIALSGRIIQQKSIHTTIHDSSWKNFRNNLKRFFSTEIQGAKLQVEVYGNQFELITDKEGYFNLNASLIKPLPSFPQDWITAQISLTETPLRQLEVYAEADLLVPQNCQYGIISDIDDTILQTHVTSLLKLRMLYLTFWKNAFKRNAFKEVAAFYNALQKGTAEGIKNPIFYVSNGPWNLYDFIIDFLHINELPKGPVLLRDFGIPLEKVPRGYQGHKKEKIKKIMKMFPGLPFIFIGDSGEKDTDIYLSLAKEFPGRVKSIYIRDVESPRRAKRIMQLIKNASGIDAYFVKDYYQAAEYAAKKEYLDFETFKQLRKDATDAFHT